MYVSNSRKNCDESIPEMNDWNLLPYLLKEKGENITALGKKDLPLFYWKYLKFKPDIIVTTWVPAGFIPVFFKKLGLVKCPIVHRWEDYYTETMTNYPRWIVAFMENFTIKNADYIITVLKTLKEKAEKMGKEVFLLPYGSLTEKKKTKINLNKFLSKKGNLRIVYAGDLATLWKRVDCIIEACKNEDCDLFLFGKNVNTYFKKIAKGNKNIHFMGFVNPKEIISVLKQADVLVNTANHDICVKFLDYIRAGKTILAFNERPANFFKHKETAYLTNNLKEGVKELIRNKKLRKKIERNMKKIKLYTWEDVANIHLRLYKKIILGENLDEFKTSYFHINY